MCKRLKLCCYHDKPPPLLQPLDPRSTSANVSCPSPFSFWLLGVLIFVCYFRNQCDCDLFWCVIAYILELHITKSINFEFNDALKCLMKCLMETMAKISTLSTFDFQFAVHNFIFSSFFFGLNLYSAGLLFVWFPNLQLLLVLGYLYHVASFDMFPSLLLLTTDYCNYRDSLVGFQYSQLVGFKSWFPYSMYAFLLLLHFIILV